MNVVWRFVAGLTKMKEIGWDTMYRGSVSTSVLECVFEGQDNRSVCDQHISKSQKVRYIGQALSSYVATALGYCI